MSRNGGASGYLPEIGIPTGLNRIKTRRVELNSDSDQFDDSSNGASISGSYAKQKSEVVSNGHVKLFGSKQGLRKGRKISRWFTSSLLKHSDQAEGDFPICESKAMEFKKHEEDPRRKFRKMKKNVSGDHPEITSIDKGSRCVKSFSHELGPKGGIQSLNPRSRSYSSMKELLRSLRSRFDAAKEIVNIELGCFSTEMLEVLQTDDSLTPDEYQTVEDLCALTQECIQMTSFDFRTRCETIVQDLTVKRQTCQAGVLKLLFTRILFILTRCTRLLHFEKDSGTVNEQSIDKFRACLKRIPSIDKNWVEKRGFADSDIGYALKLSGDAQQNLQGADQMGVPSCSTESRPNILVDNQGTEVRIHHKFTARKRSQNLLRDVLLDGKQFHNFDGEFQMEATKRDKENYVDDSNLVICRICEELVPATHLEAHSYICAFADNCVSKHLDVDERLLKLAELLEYLLELRSSGSNESNGHSENMKALTATSALASDNYSPRYNEWRTKGMDGMLEDLHEMDTACIDESNVTNLLNLKSHLLTKVNHCGPPSSSGSITSSSATNSPRSGNFDIFWLDQNNLSEQEDMQQVIDLADVARCVAGTHLHEEGSHEVLLAYLQDLQEILQNSKHKALLVDTFGSRVESLLREKYILACNLADKATDTGPPESAWSSLDSTSQSSATSTPSHPRHKESTSIDDFRIIKPISRGAFGKVFLARKRTTGDLFAIKVLKKLDMLRKNDIDRILAERNILITVRNPFVVRFFYSFTSRDKLYLVMEYLNGGDLYSLLRMVGCLEESVARTYIAELVLALEYLHSLGIVHRDLKPDNILIAHDGHIKLTDFGLSKIGIMSCTTELSASEATQNDVSDTSGKLNTQTEDNHRSALGTPDYLAPEILLGTEHGYAADWWSVGIILFEFITGIPPFAADRPEIIFDNILNRKIPWPSVPIEMSYEAQNLIDRFLVHDPEHRLGAKGASEVKAHPFFSGLDWNNLALQNAAFVPQPDTVDDTSYFVSRYNSPARNDGENSDSDSNSSESDSSLGLEKMDECGDLADFDSSPLDISLMNFSFKNLSQLASINHDVLLQSGRDSSRCSSPSLGLNRISCSRSRTPPRRKRSIGGLDNLALQNAAFVPQLDSVDDTSYFVSTNNSPARNDGENSDSDSNSSESDLSLEVEKMDEYGDLTDFDSSPLDISLMNFSFKNLSQLASINHDVLLQSGRDSSRCFFVLG